MTSASSQAKSDNGPFTNLTQCPGLARATLSKAKASVWALAAKLICATLRHPVFLLNFKC